MALMPKQVFQELEFSGRQVKRTVSACGTARHEIELQVCRFQPQDFRRSTAPQQRADARQELGQRERFDEIVVGAEVESEHPVLHTVTGGQDEDGRLDAPVPQRPQDFKAVPPGEHHVEHDEVERLGIRAKKPVFAGRRHHHVIVLPLQRGREDLRQLPFVFDDQDTHWMGMLPSQARVEPDFCVRLSVPFPSQSGSLSAAGCAGRRGRGRAKRHREKTLERRRVGRVNIG